MTSEASLPRLPHGSTLEEILTFSRLVGRRGREQLTELDLIEVAVRDLFWRTILDAAGARRFPHRARTLRRKEGSGPHEFSPQLAVALEAARLAAGRNEATFADFLMVLASPPLRDEGFLSGLGCDCERLLNILHGLRTGVGKLEVIAPSESFSDPPTGWMIPTS